jgi:ubiquinone/menaquinone biosynthesis C-methylase UbiE
LKAASGSYGWVLRFPRVLARSFRLKQKNHRLGADETYEIHQKQFFATELTDAGSDKFSAIRRRVALYAFGEGCQRALDVATGRGFQAGALRDVGIPHVVGVDFVTERIQSARTLFPEGIDFQVMDASRLPYPDGYFDCATVSAALHDMPALTRRKVIAEMARVTRRTVVVFEPRTLRNPLLAYLYGTVGDLLDESLNFRSYVREDLATILQENGLRIERDENVWGWLMNIKVCRVAARPEGETTRLPPDSPREA